MNNLYQQLNTDVISVAQNLNMPIVFYEALKKTLRAGLCPHHDAKTDYTSAHNLLVRSKKDIVDSLIIVRKAKPFRDEFVEEVKLIYHDYMQKRVQLSHYDVEQQCLQHALLVEFEILHLFDPKRSIHNVFEIIDNAINHLSACIHLCSLTVANPSDDQLGR